MRSWIGVFRLVSRRFSSYVFLNYVKFDVTHAAITDDVFCISKAS